MFGRWITGIIRFASVDCEQMFSTILWISNLALDNSEKNAGSKNNSYVHKPVDNFVDNLFISPLLYTDKLILEEM